MRPRHAGPPAAASSSLPAAAGSLLSDASFGEELLVALAEPDEVLDSQVNVIDASEAVERHSPVFTGATEKCTNTKRGICHYSAKKLSRVLEILCGAFQRCSHVRL